MISVTCFMYIWLPKTPMRNCQSVSESSLELNKIGSTRMDGNSALPIGHLVR